MLRALARILPTRLAHRDVFFGAFLERERLGLLDHQGGLSSGSVRYRVNAIQGQQMSIGRLLASLGESYAVEIAKPHLAGLTCDHEPEHPRLGFAIAHLQVKAAAVAIQARLEIGLLCELDG